MDRGDLWATVHGVTRGGNNLAIKQLLTETILMKNWCHFIIISNDNILSNDLYSFDHLELDMKL